LTRSLDDFGEPEETVKHAVLSQDWNVRPLRQALSVGQIALRLLPLAVLVSSCGGGGDASNQLAPILQVGMQREYVGTATRSVVYTNPTATLQNNTLVYTFTENQTVQQAATGAPANFDVQSDYTYSVVQNPGVGTVPASQSVDTYENLQTAADTQTVITLGQKVVAVSNDETANALGNGPYTETSTTTSTFTTPRDNFPYPLQTGATLTTPQSETQTITFTDVNASGAAPSNGTNVGYATTRSENDDGSFSYQSTYVNGDTFSRTQNSDGSGSETSKSATSSITTTVGLPVAANGANTIPVARTVTSTPPTATNYSAADWYPDSGAPNSPLVLQTKMVVGPASSLPSECNGAVLQPNIYEIDTTTTNLNTVAASYSATTTRNFSAGDGASICQLSTETSSSYDVLTGALISTTTTTTTTLLSAINY
jgi:hypothetical protein